MHFLRELLTYRYFTSCCISNALPYIETEYILNIQEVFPEHLEVRRWLPQVMMKTSNKGGYFIATYL